MRLPESVIPAPSPDPRGLPASARLGPAAEATAEFLLRLRARGVRDLGLLRALEAVPRDLFVPHRYADLAARDVALPIPCGQVMSEPSVVARMAEALGATPASRVLEIGAGSGYTTAVLARLAGEVLSVERYRSLAVQARTRLDVLGVSNAAVVWADGGALPASAGLFDRLLVHAVLDVVPAPLQDRMAPDAVMVYARTAAPGSGARQMLVRASRVGGAEWVLRDVCPSRLRPLDAGVSQGL